MISTSSRYSLEESGFARTSMPNYDSWVESTWNFPISPKKKKITSDDASAQILYCTSDSKFKTFFPKVYLFILIFHFQKPSYNRVFGPNSFYYYFPLSLYLFIQMTLAGEKTVKKRLLNRTNLPPIRISINIIKQINFFMSFWNLAEDIEETSKGQK